MLRRIRVAWVKHALIGLIFEKIIQHVVVTLALYFNWADIESTVAVSPRLLMIVGAAVAALFVLSLWGITTQQKWAMNLVIALALVDIVGEFVAQGRISIVITLSFIVAIALLLLALSYCRQGQRRVLP